MSRGLEGQCVPKQTVCAAGAVGSHGEARAEARPILRPGVSRSGERYFFWGHGAL